MLDHFCFGETMYGNLGYGWLSLDLRDGFVLRKCLSVLMTVAVCINSQLPWQWKRCWLLTSAWGCQQWHLSNWSHRRKCQFTVIWCWDSTSTVHTSKNDVHVLSIRRSSTTLRINDRISVVGNSWFWTECRAFRINSSQTEFGWFNIWVVYCCEFLQKIC